MQVWMVKMEPALAIVDLAKIDDIRTLEETLKNRGLELTIENAVVVFRRAWLFKPAAWTINIDELPALWRAMAIEN